MTNHARPPRWTAAEMDSYERARDLLNAVISAYSGRIGVAPGPDVARALRAERAPLLAERDSLSADDRERVAEILFEMPERLRSVRAGGAGE
ncbi:hypothetical protein [Streptomyces sp. NPDC059142]|uniref:hypothetical protein n=1 Tax=Streptomyces sp. NPDC059142 TaxID=3346739 RepID=UPI0036C6979F